MQEPVHPLAPAGLDEAPHKVDVRAREPAAPRPRSFRMPTRFTTACWPAQSAASCNRVVHVRGDQPLTP
jgi:hypothetical protein